MKDTAVPAALTTRQRNALFTDAAPLIELNAEQLREVERWAADDSLWTTQETVAFNLKIFARVILAADR
jgi:hypothetical protein